MSRTPVIAGNWKMFKTQAETSETCRRLRSLVDGWAGVEVVVFPPFTALGAAREQLQGSSIAWGGQDCHWEDFGAFTSEVSLPMLEDLGCRYVILGHSETRQFLGETNERINLKLIRVLKSTLTPIVCVGESLEQRQGGRAREVVLGQLAQCLAGLTVQDLSRIIIAYEPIWAIGTGQTATPETAQDVHYMIRKWLGETFTAATPTQVRILYGGSVNPKNVGSLMAQDDIDGALVGGASLDAESFAKIVKFRE